MKIKSPKNLWAGLMFIGFGLFSLTWALTHYQMGSAVRMGPAYFPTMLGGLLAVLGLIILVQSLVVKGPALPAFPLRSIAWISGSILAYGYLMKPLGLVLSTTVMVFIAAFAGHEFKWKEVAALAVALVIFSVLVFVKGLTLPFPLWPAALS